MKVDVDKIPESVKKALTYLRHPKAIFFELVQIPPIEELLEEVAKTNIQDLFFISDLEKLPAQLPMPVRDYIHRHKQDELSFFKPGTHAILISPFIPLYRGWILEAYMLGDAEKLAKYYQDNGFVVVGYTKDRIQTTNLYSIFSW